MRARREVYRPTWHFLLMDEFTVTQTAWSWIKTKNFNCKLKKKSFYCRHSVSKEYVDYFLWLRGFHCHLFVWIKYQNDVKNTDVFIGMTVLKCRPIFNCDKNKQIIFILRSHMFENLRKQFHDDSNAYRFMSINNLSNGKPDSFTNLEMNTCHRSPFFLNVAIGHVWAFLSHYSSLIVYKAVRVMKIVKFFLGEIQHNLHIKKNNGIWRYF